MTKALTTTARHSRRPGAIAWHARTRTYLETAVHDDAELCEHDRSVLELKWQAALFVLVGLGYFSPAAARPPARQADGRCSTGPVSSPAIQKLIREIFGPRHAPDAIQIARCESGRQGTRAVTGQFRGLFQMGRWARRHFGHGRCAEQQAQAAYRYFVAEQRSWMPWRGCVRPQLSQR
jgi:hypothetical protein